MLNIINYYINLLQDRDLDKDDRNRYLSFVDALVSQYLYNEE